MQSVTKMFIRARESMRRKVRGQTMTEYALILAATASWCTAPTAPWETTTVEEGRA
jgi:hypothetical protein